MPCKMQHPAAAATAGGVEEITQQLERGASYQKAGLGQASLPSEPAENADPEPEYRVLRRERREMLARMRNCSVIGERYGLPPRCLDMLQDHVSDLTSGSTISEIDLQRAFCSMRNFKALFVRRAERADDRDHARRLAPMVDGLISALRDSVDLAP